MRRKMRAALLKAATLTFEELGFLLATEELDEQQRAASEAGGVVVGFRGPFSGALELRVCGDLLPMLAANMLGQDEAPPERLQRDGLGEIANVICGNVLPMIVSEDGPFDLDSPRLIRADERLATDVRDRVMVEASLGLEQGRADLRLWIADATAL